MTTELWFPDLRPPPQQLMLSVLYGDGFSSVVPSWKYRDLHEGWGELEELADRGLYVPFRLSDLVTDLADELSDEIARSLFQLARRTSQDRQASPDMAAWAAQVMGEEPAGRANHEGWESWSLPVMSSLHFLPGSTELERSLGFVREQDEDHAFRLAAPRPVVDQLVELSVLHEARNRSDFVPTTMVRTAAGPMPRQKYDGVDLALRVSLPAPPANWSLAKALEFRDAHADELHSLRAHMSAVLADAEASMSNSSPDEIADYARERLHGDIRTLRRALEPHGPRAITKKAWIGLREQAVGLAVGTGLATVPIDLADSLTVEVATGAALPLLAGAVGTYAARRRATRSPLAYAYQLQRG